jgi:rsbT co-antagonist protein RsbR
MAFLQQILTVQHSDPDTQRRGRTMITVALSLVVIMLLALPVVFTRTPADRLPSLVTLLLGLGIVGGTIVLARSGRVDLAGWALVITTGLAVIFPSIVRGDVSSSLLYLLVPVLIAGVVLKPWQIWVALGFAYALLAIDVARLPAAVRNEPEAFILLSNTVLILFIGTLISFIGARIAAGAFVATQQAQQAVDAASHQLAELNASLEAQVQARTQELSQALAEVEIRAVERQHLLEEIENQRDAIREMSVPILPVRAGTLVLPLVGALDSERLNDLQTQALTALERSRAHTLLLDVTGVPIVDTYVARGIMRTVQAARLLGANAVLIGVRPEVAQALVTLGVDLSDVHTAADLQSALAA